tara:strand:- start:438 stop:605 length:168 start_codon:yes stop_codon:yes gene_type:complete
MALTHQAWFTNLRLEKGPGQVIQAFAALRWKESPNETAQQEQQGGYFEREGKELR